MNRNRRLLLLSLIAGVAILGVLMVGSAAAQTNNSTLNGTAPYYPNQTAVGNQTSWLPENVTLDTLGSVGSRIGPLIIGTGDQIPGGTTFAGTIATGLLMAFIFLGAIMGTPVGIGGGAVVASVTGYGLAELGLAPAWLKAVVVMIIGAVAAIAAYRTTQ